MKISKTTLLTISADKYLAVILALFIVSFIGLFIPLMEVDATQYASMSLELLQSNSILQFTDLGKPYLDKPPLLFWVSSIFISLLGNTTVAFKLGSFIMAWCSVYFLYRFVLLYYKKNIAQLAAVIYAGNVAFILFTNDIRTDTLLISFVLLSIWQFAEYLKTYKTVNFIIASIAVGFAMLAKGPIGIVVPALALTPHVLLTSNYKAIFSWKPLLMPLVVFLVLSPMLLGLYQQFGMHGIRFYFWEQSFGRITGENVWQNDASKFYFLHNIAWAFIPYTFFLIIALIKCFLYFGNLKEHISFFGLILPFIALSFSQYKLPHYIYIVIPFASILTANFIEEWTTNKQTSWLNYFLFAIQYILILALLILPYALLYAFEGSVIMYVILIVFQIIIFFYFYKIDNVKQRILSHSIVFFIVAAAILNGFAYPNLLKYQGSSTAAFYIKQQKIPKEKIFQKNIYHRAFYYYTGNIVPEFNSSNYKKGIYIYTDEKGKEEIKEKYEINEIKSFDDFNVTRLSFLFLNPKARKNTLNKKYLIKL